MKDSEIVEQWDTDDGWQYQITVRLKTHPAPYAVARWKVVLGSPTGRESFLRLDRVWRAWQQGARHVRRFACTPCRGCAAISCIGSKGR